MYRNPIIRRVILLLFQGVSPWVISAQSLTSEEIKNWRDDVRVMAMEMPKVHRDLFHTMSREQFESAIERLQENIPTLARHQIIVEMARIAAMVGDGHTNVAPTRDPKIGFHSLPVQFYFFDDGLFIRAAADEYKNLVGARVVKVGDVPIDSAYVKVRTLIGKDNEMGAKFFAPFLLTMPEVLHALGLSASVEQARFTIDQNGRTSLLTLRAGGPAELLAPDTDTSWTPRVGWTDARDVSRQPLWLQHPSNKFLFEYLSDSKTVYVQFNQVGNKEGETVASFCDSLFTFVEKNPVEKFVLDLRLNRGGNGEVNRPLLLGIIRCTKIDQPGKLFTIIGRDTWSAAQFLVNDLERYANTIFVGEPTGGKPNSYGDSKKIVLPHSGITVRVSSLWWQGDERDKRSWVAPLIAADLSFDVYEADQDPALDAILHYKPEPPLTQFLREEIAERSSSGLKEKFRAWRSVPEHRYIDAEPLLNELGYQLLAANQPGDAVAVFKLCAETFPRSSNAFDSLADGYLAAGEKGAAMEFYLHALQLDPKNWSAAESMKKLRSQ